MGMWEGGRVGEWEGRTVGKLVGRHCWQSVPLPVFASVSQDVPSMPARAMALCFPACSRPSLIPPSLLLPPPPQVRAAVGGRLRLIVSGGAPLSPESQRFMNICFG